MDTKIYKAICANIFELYSYSDALKIVHYTTEKYHFHTLSDDIRNDVIEFSDTFLESFFGEYGKPKGKDLSLSQESVKFDNLRSACSAIIEKLEALYTLVRELKGNKGLLSLMDDFYNKMEQHKFLSTFDELKGE